MIGIGSRYTGIKTAPSITTVNRDNEDASVAYYCKSGNMITVMFVLTESNTDVSDASKNALFIAKGSVSNLIHDEDGDYKMKTGERGPAEGYAAKKCTLPAERNAVTIRLRYPAAE